MRPRLGCGTRAGWMWPHAAATAWMGHAPTAEATATEAAGVPDGGVGEAAQAGSRVHGRGGEQRCAGHDQQRGAKGGAQVRVGVHAQFPSAVVACAATATGTNTIRVAPLGLNASSLALIARRVSHCSAAW